MSEQDKIAQKYEKAESLIIKEKREGDVWYIISKQWWDTVKSFAKFGGPTPTKLCFSSLLLNNEIKDTLLLSEVQEIPEELLNELIEWFGIEDHSKEQLNVIKRNVVNDGFTCKVEIRPSTMKISCDGNSTKVKAYLFWTVEKLKQEAATLLKLDNASEYEVFEYLTMATPLEEEAVIASFSKNKSFHKFELRKKDTTHSQLSTHVTSSGTSYGTTTTKGLTGSTSSKISTSSSSSPQHHFYSKPNYSSYGTSRYTSHTPPGQVGLANLGNTCFMNSALQCLSHTQVLRDFFLSGKFQNEINRTNPIGCKGQLAEEFHKLMLSMWSKPQSSVSPASFKRVVGHFAPRFSGYQQQDAQELLAFVLDGLHEDLNRVVQKPYVEQKEAGDLSDEQAATEAWHRHKLRNDSKIVDIFQAQLRSQLTCPDCNKVSVTFDPFMYLSLPIPELTKKIVKVRLVKLDGSECIVMTSIPETSGTIRHVKVQVSTVTAIKSSRLIAADVFRESIYSDMEDHERASRNASTLWMFEIPEYDSESQQIVWIDLATDSKYSYSTTCFGHPYLVVVPKNDVSISNILDSIYASIPWLFKLPVTSNEEEQAEDDEQKFSIQKLQLAGKAGYNFQTLKEEDEKPSLYSDKSNLEKVLTVAKKSYTRYPVLRLLWPSDLKAQYYKTLPTSQDLQVLNKEEVEKESSNTKKTVDIQDCLKLFSTPEQLTEDNTWYCSKCEKQQMAEKHMQLWNLPEVLVIHLKRFSYDRYWRDKISTVVDFPLKNLDLSEFVLSGDARANAVYDLFGVSNHMGGLGGGHYTAYASDDDGVWRSYDDRYVSKASPQDLVSPSAYLLFYQRRQETDAE